jgi:hypothetical protein
VLQIGRYNPRDSLLIFYDKNLFIAHRSCLLFS